MARDVVERLREEWAEAWRQESDAEVAAWAEKYGEALLAVVEAAKMEHGGRHPGVGRCLVCEALARLYAGSSGES